MASVQRNTSWTKPRSFDLLADYSYENTRTACFHRRTNTHHPKTCIVRSFGGGLCWFVVVLLSHTRQGQGRRRGHSRRLKKEQVSDSVKCQCQWWNNGGATFGTATATGTAQPQDSQQTTVVCMTWIMNGVRPSWMGSRHQWTPNWMICVNSVSQWQWRLSDWDWPVSTPGVSVSDSVTESEIEIRVNWNVSESIDIKMQLVPQILIWD